MPPVISDLYQCESEDYIMVQLNVDEMRDDLSDDEDDSYDYCDDVYSVHSSGGQTPSICSETNGSVLSVPSVLLKDLDEAHAAAKLAQIEDAEDQTVDTSLSIATSNTDVEPQVEKAGKKQQVPVTTQVKPISLSRTSNKKRRKQLKLMKKKQAAANATKALAEKTMKSATPMALPKKTAAKAKKTSSSIRSKRVHPHVACATEILAAHRDAVRILNNQQIVK
jgi:hypothetical protein